MPSLIGETERHRPIGEVRQPILAVACKSLRASIRGLFFKQELQGTERALFGRASLGQRGVDLGDAPGEQPAGEAVHDDVMAAMVPEIVFRRCLEQGADPKRPCQQIDRSNELRHHPAFCRGPRIRLGADIDERKGRIQYGGNQLSGPIALLDEPYPHGFRLDSGLPQGRLEQRRIDRPVNFDGLGQIEYRIRRAEFLGKPHAGLGSGERQQLCRVVDCVHGFPNSVCL